MYQLPKTQHYMIDLTGTKLLFVTFPSNTRYTEQVSYAVRIARSGYDLSDE